MYSNVVIIPVAVVEHHRRSYVADRLHVLCYNWNASLEHGINFHGKLYTTVRKTNFRIPVQSSPVQSSD